MFLAGPLRAAVETKINVSVEGDSSSSVIVDSVTESSQTNVHTSQTDANVQISQTGEGTSSVTINGKEYKVEGPGELKVNESVSSPAEPTPSPETTPPPEASLPQIVTSFLTGLWDKILTVFSIPKD